MPTLRIKEGWYYSQLDEEAFFRWLQSIGGVKRVVGTPEGLMVTLRSAKLSESALRDLLALHFRYDLPMGALAQFQTPENRHWFRSPQAYWYARVFPKKKALTSVRADARKAARRSTRRLGV